MKTRVRGPVGLDVNWRLVGWAAMVLTLFVLWTAVVRIGVSEGSRKTAWGVSPFGVWPAHFGLIAGSADSQFSIFASYHKVAAVGESIPSPTVAGLLGYATIG